MKIGIVVPVFNVEQYLGECLDSIQNQTHKDFCCVLVDDCGTDGSAAICREYAEKDARFLFIQNEHNQGGGISRNNGIPYLKKEGCRYVMFVDSDDCLDIHCLEVLHTAILKNDCKMAISKYTREKTFRITDKTILCNGIDFYKNRHAYKDYPSNCATCKLYDISLADELLFSGGIMHEDIWVIPRVTMMCNGKKDIVLVDAEMYYYRTVPTSESNIKFTIKKIDRILGFRSCADYCLEAQNGCEQHFLSCMFGALRDQKIYLKKNKKLYAKDEYNEYFRALMNTQKELLGDYDRLWKATRAAKYDILYCDGSFFRRVIRKLYAVSDRVFPPKK